METNWVQQEKPFASRSTCTIVLPSCGQCPARNGSPTLMIGGHTSYFRVQKPVLDRGGFGQCQCGYALRLLLAGGRGEAGHFFLDIAAQAKPIDRTMTA